MIKEEQKEYKKDSSDKTQICVFLIIYLESSFLIITLILVNTDMFYLSLSLFLSLHTQKPFTNKEKNTHKQTHKQCTTTPKKKQLTITYRFLPRFYTRKSRCRETKENHTCSLFRFQGTQDSLYTSYPLGNPPLYCPTLSFLPLEE